MKMRFVKLQDVAETSCGGTPNRGNKKFYGGTIPWIKSGELPDGEIIEVQEKITQEAIKNSSAKIINCSTLLIAMYGATVGKLGIPTFPAATNQAVCAIQPSEELDRDYLFYYLLSIRKELIVASFGGAQPNISQDTLRNLTIPVLSIEVQQEMAKNLKKQFSEIEKAREAIIEQKKEISNLANAIIYESLSKDENHVYSLGSVLDEVKVGIGEKWEQYPVYGATRTGIALAKEPPGKHAQKYKPVIPGTVFYNPMRILIGSIAFAETDVEDGITSPDYVVLKGKEGLVDSRWFYFWLRSPLGVQCINSLARGAVRERMLFNRLAEGQIELPDYILQKEASEVLLNLKQVSVNLNKQLKEIEALPNKILSSVFKDV